MHGLILFPLKSQHGLNSIGLRWEGVRPGTDRSSNGRTTMRLLPTKRESYGKRSPTSREAAIGAGRARSAAQSGDMYKKGPNATQ